MSDAAPEGDTQRRRRVLAGIIIFSACAVAILLKAASSETVSSARSIDDALGRPANVPVPTVSALGLTTDPPREGPNGTAPISAPLPAFNPSTKAYYGVLNKIRAMSDAELYPRLDASREVRTRAGAGVCFIAVLGMPHVCGRQKRPDLVEACAQHWGAPTLATALPEKCRDLPYWKEIVAPRFPNADPAGAKLGPLAPDPVGDARKEVIDKFCQGKECVRHPPIGRDYVVRSQAAYARQPLPYVPPDQRTYLKDLPVRRCGGQLPFTAYPINFGIVEALIVPKPYSDRIWDFMPFMRLFDLSKWDPYKMGERDEFMSHEVYRRSFFGFTHRRGGWDCFRHYEILAAGSLPYFPDLARCDKICLAGLPKDLIEEGMNLPGISFVGRVEGPHRFSTKNTTFVPANPEYLVLAPEVKPPTNVNFRKLPQIDWSLFDRAKYDDLVGRTLDFTRKYLTTKAVVAGMLHRIGVEEPKNVLFLGRDLTDYMEMTIEHGLAELGIKYTTDSERPHGHQVLFGEHDHEPTTSAMDHHRTHVAQLHRFHGRATGYGMRVPPLPADHNASKESIKRRIENKEFDLVIYGYLQLPFENQAFFNEVRAHVPKERIVVVCGNDNLGGGDWAAEMHFVNRHAGFLFRRELEDFPCLA